MKTMTQQAYHQQRHQNYNKYNTYYNTSHLQSSDYQQTARRQRVVNNRSQVNLYLGFNGCSRRHRRKLIGDNLGDNTYWVFNNLFSHTKVLWVKGDGAKLRVYLRFIGLRSMHNKALAAARDQGPILVKYYKNKTTVLSQFSLGYIWLYNKLVLTQYIRPCTLCGASNSRVRTHCVERAWLSVCVYRVVRLELQAGRVLTSLLAVFLSAAELNNTQVIAHNHSPSLPELSTKASNQYWIVMF